MPLKPGDHIDRYVIDALLGSGGMGDVYRAHDARLRRSVALKILQPEPASSSNDRPGPAPTGGAARMLREARAVAALDHPNVVAIFDVGEIAEPADLRGTAYLAMELIKGTPLRTYIGDAGVPMTEKVRWLTDIARALGAAHAAGLVHRDVKPENVMIRDDGCVKVLDFGVAKRAVNSPVDATSSTEGYTVPTMTGQGLVVGTPVYMAPEQLRAEDLDGRADQFAWAVVAHELLSGTPPWSVDGGGIALVAQILSASPPSLANRPDVPAHVAEVVARAMSKDRAARFPSMEDVIDALTGSVNALGATQPRIPTHSVAPRSKGEGPRVVVNEGPTAPLPLPQLKTARSEHPPRRAPRLLGLVGGAAVALVAVSAVLALRARTSTAPPSAHVAAATRGCASNTECTRRLGEAAVCHHDDGACAARASPDCKVLAADEALASDATLWVGTLFPLSGTEATYGRPNAEAVDLARREIADAERPVAAMRPIGVVSCDDVADAARAARHLVADVRAPAVIGFRSSQEAIDLAGSIFIPAGVLTMAALNMSPIVTTLPSPPGQPRLVWRTTLDLAATAAPLAALVSQVIEPRLRKGAPAGLLRVAIVRAGGPGPLAFSDAVFRALSFNGKSALENGSDYREVVVDTPSAVDGAASALVAFAPNIVFVQGAQLASMIAAIEDTWPTGVRRPTYLDPGIPDEDDLGLIGKHPDVRRRLYGVTSASQTSANARFVMRFNEAFAPRVTREASPNTAYDALYAIGYASFAVDGAVTGASLARAFDRFQPSGRAIEVGPTSIFEAYSALRSAGAIDVTGATTKLRFDPVTGELPIDLSILCFKNGADGTSLESVESGMIYDALAHRLAGVLGCK